MSTSSIYSRSIHITEQVLSLSYCSKPSQDTQKRKTQSADNRPLSFRRPIWRCVLQTVRQDVPFEVGKSPMRPIFISGIDTRTRPAVAIVVIVFGDRWARKERQEVIAGCLLSPRLQPRKPTHTHHGNITVKRLVGT